MTTVNGVRKQKWETYHMKAVQGDSGHAQMKMVADVYSHIIDEDRCINALTVEDKQAFGQFMEALIRTLPE